MKILVTGARGQVGAALLELGKARGHDMAGYDRKSLDISCSEAVEAMISHEKPDLVINAAAYTAVDKAEEEEALALAVNAAGPEYLASVCQGINIPFFHISTDFVFNGEKDGPYLETDKVDPLSVYGRSKAVGEARVAEIGGQYIILRTAWVFGGEQNFVATILRLAGSHDELNIVDDQVGGPTSSRDIATTLLIMAERVREEGFSDWGIYHYCGAPSVSWCGFAKAILAGRDRPVINPVPTEGYPLPAMRPKNSTFDCGKIARIFGIDPPDWRTALSEYLETR